MKTLIKENPCRKVQSDNMPKTYTWTELLAEWPDIQKKEVVFNSVLGNPGSIYYLQQENLLVSVNGLRGNQPLYLVTRLVSEYGGKIIHIQPSQVPTDTQKKDFGNSLIVNREQLTRIIPDINKVSPSKVGYVSMLDRLEQITQSGQYFFHSAQGVNFIVTCAGYSFEGETLYRVYQLVVENDKPLTLRRPVAI
jgi:hypothetical protein